MHVLVAGAGATGSHAARHVLRLLPDATVSVLEPHPARASHLVDRLGNRAVMGGPVGTGPRADVVVLCAPSAEQPPMARAALRVGSAVVSVADGPADVAGLLALDADATERGLPLVVGAGFAPGLSCVLARHAANSFDAVDEVHVAKTGTGGPACARQHHAALSGRNRDWRDGTWVNRRGGSGRQLAFFPEPIGARDCYRAALGDPLLLQRAFPGAARVTARMSATRRDRLTAWLPMLRPPHADGGPGGVRVEVWGQRGGQRDVVVYGAIDHPALAAGTVAAVAVWGIATGLLPQTGAFGLAEVASAVPLLDQLDRLGIGALSFEGAP